MRYLFLPLALCLGFHAPVFGQTYSPKMVTNSSPLLTQNNRANEDGIPRVKNIHDISALKDEGILEDLPSDLPGIIINIHGKAYQEREVATPQLINVLTWVGERFKIQVSKPIFLSSTVRTVAGQTRLRKSRIRARRHGRHLSLPAPSTGPNASMHLRGVAADLSLRNLKWEERECLRNILTNLHQEGFLDFGEEGSPHHFHVVAYSEALEKTPTYPFYFQPPEINIKHPLLFASTR